MHLVKQTPTPETYRLPYTTLFRSDGGHHAATDALQEAKGNKLAHGLRLAAQRGSDDEDGHRRHVGALGAEAVRDPAGRRDEDRKSTRLNSSHMSISYAVFCLKKEK